MNIIKQFRFNFVLLVMAFAVASCATVPELDTNAKRLIAAEISLQELSMFAINSKDRMDADTREAVKGMINDSHEALKVARTAHELGNEADFTDGLTTANSLIAALRPILLELE